MKTRQLWFVKPGQVQVRERELPALQQDQVLVQTRYSAISAGTEMLAYRGELPNELALDQTLEAFQGCGSTYPFRYGYACVGRVLESGTLVDPALNGKRVFAFQPHASHFITTPDQLYTLPETVQDLDAVFLANMETAVTLVQDAVPLLQEQVVLIGQGVVGLLATAILSDFPLQGLYALDKFDLRRTMAATLGAHGAFDPVSEDDLDKLKLALASDPPGADLLFELSGSPGALNLAMDLSGFASRIVVGSWYGSKASQLHLGGSFHRNRINIISSQVSTLSPALSGRWDKTRRFDAAWAMVAKVRPEQLVTHLQAFESASATYALLDETPAEVLQAVFEHRPDD